MTASNPLACVILSGPCKEECDRRWAWRNHSAWRPPLARSRLPL